MSASIATDASDEQMFSLPYVLPLLGEHQHLLGAGSILLATHLRLRIQIEETDGEFQLAFKAPGRGPEDAGQPGLLSDCARRVRGALAEHVVSDPSLLDGMRVSVDFGVLRAVCPAGVLSASPALAAGLAVAVGSHWGAAGVPGQEELPELACRLCDAVAPVPGRNADCFYGEALLSILGGAAYVEPGGQPLNVQQLLPPESLLLALVPGLAAVPGPNRSDRVVREALAGAHGAGCDVMAPGDEGIASLFALPDGVLEQDAVAMLYGLLRVRQMIDAFLEHLGEPFVDNDRLAEVCEEESEILADYFGFPAEPYAKIRASAGQAGAMSAKLTWAFGGYPTAVIMAPGRRPKVHRALAKRFPQAHFLPVNLDTTGLIRGDEEAAGLPSD